MAMVQGRKRLVIAASVLGLVVLIVGTVALLHFLNRPNDPNPDTTTETAQPEKQETTPQPETVTEEPDTTQSTVDPATLASIDIEPLEITVSYSRGVGGFEYSVQRTSSGTRYVDFSSSELVGTKCTDDSGVFASIIQGVKSEEDNTTISQTTKVGETTYGLSLTGDNCAADLDLLKEYQAAFSNGFSQLKEMQ
jgi:cytoskeletal protein RodZ